jgi:tetratricopeptide (TPR) repeat protein
LYEERHEGEEKVNTESGRMKGFFGGLFLTVVTGLLLVLAAWWLLTILGEYPTLLLALSSFGLLALLFYAGVAIFGFHHREQGQDLGEQWIAEEMSASGARDAGSWAQLERGLTFDAQGEYDRAVEAYQQAIDSGPTEAATRAAFNLGLMFKEHGEYRQAVGAYQQVIASEHAEWAPKATFNLGILFEERREYNLAKDAYQQTIDSEHWEAASKARLNLGVLFEEMGEYDRAVEAYQKAIYSRHPEAVALAVGNLRGLPMRESARVTRHLRYPPHASP